MITRLPTIVMARATRIKVISLLILAGMIGILFLINAIALWFDNNKLTFRFPMGVSFYQLVTVEKRTTTVLQPVVAVEYPEEIDTDIEKYICDKFGVYECKTALAVAKAESGLREDAMNINTNGTVDFGIYQINSANWKLQGCSIKEIVDAKKNVDCAYKMWDRADGIEGNGKGAWNPWVAYQNESYLAKL